MTTNVTSSSRGGSTAAAEVQRDAEALHAAISDLVRVYQFRDRDRICCHDISITQCYALEALVSHGPMRLGALADRLYLDKSTTSRVVSALVRKGYVEQRLETNDRRATAIMVTRSGRRLRGRIVADLVEQQKALLRDLPPEVRAGVIRVIRGVATLAESRFLTGVSATAAACLDKCATGDAAKCV